MARDKGGLEATLTHTWVVEQSPPELLLLEAPADRTPDANVTFHFAGAIRGEAELCGKCVYTCRVDAGEFYPCEGGSPIVLSWGENLNRRP